MSADQPGLKLQAAERRVSATLRECVAARRLRDEGTLTPDEYELRVRAHKEARSALQDLLEWLSETV